MTQYETATNALVRRFMGGTIIPFWVTIILIVVAVIGVTFTGLFWWHSNRRPGARAQPHEETGEFTRPGPLQRYQIPTLYFQQHEPETHGYFAPVYLDPSSQAITDPRVANAAKSALRDHLVSESSMDSEKSEVKAPPPVVNSHLPGRI